MGNAHIPRVFVRCASLDRMETDELFLIRRTRGLLGFSKNIASKWGYDRFNR